jgi:type 1 fimbria pilin
MKKYFAALTTTALISAAPFALAASSTDLTVTGIITPVACTPSFTGGGDIDIGKISSGDLNQDINTLVGSDPIQLVVNCDAATKFALNPIDNQPGTSIGDWFGLGLTPDDEKLGFFFPKVVQVKEGATALDAIKSNDGGTTWVKAGDAQAYLLSFTNASGSLPIDAKNVTFEFEVDTYISRADQLNLKNEVTIDGSATFEVKYL